MKVFVRDVIFSLGGVLALSACGGDGDQVPPPPPIQIPTPPPSPAPAPSPTPAPAAPLNTTAAAAFLESIDSFGMVVLQNGALINETYINGYDGVDGKPIASGTKSFICPLVAAAEVDGLLNPDTVASQSIAAWQVGGAAPQASLKSDIRVRHLMSLTSGLSGEGATGPALNQVDSYAQAIGAPSLFKSDYAAVYTPNNHQALMTLFELRSGGRFDSDGVIRGGNDPLTYLTQKVLQPIGLQVRSWSRDKNNKPNFGGGASIRATEWAKFGQFMLDDGVWQGRRILPSGLLNRCSTYRTDAFLGYGLGFFLNRSVGSSYQSDQDRMDVARAVDWDKGGRLAPSVPDDMYMAAGAGGYRLYIIPSLKLVVVRYGGKEPNNSDNSDNIFLGKLLNKIP